MTAFRSLMTLLAVGVMALLNACGGSDTPPAPTVSIAFTPSSVPAGQSATLSWSSTNAASCTAGGAWSGVQGTSGSESVTPGTVGSATYQLSCSGPGGTVEQSATLTALANVVLNVSPSPALVGLGATLAWTGYGVSACNASGAWSGAQPATGTLAVSPSVPGSYTYTLTCTSATGNVADSATLTVNPNLTVTVTPGSNVLGQAVTLTWSALGVISCSGTGDWSGPQAASGTLTVTPASTGPHTYTLTCTAANGTFSQSATAVIDPAVTLAVSPGSVAAGGSASLSWTVNGATTCSAGDAWKTTPSPAGGSFATSPTTPGAYLYALTCADALGDATTVWASLTVTDNGFARTDLVANVAGTAALNVDAGLLDPWGIALPATQAAVAADAQANASTVYDGSGVPVAAGVVHLPASAAGAPFNPTGVVVPTNNPQVTGPKGTGSVQLIYAGESGMIAAWSPGADPANAIGVYTASDGAVYRGLAISGGFLFAADFHNGKIDVFDTSFKKFATSATSYPFTDPSLPAGYAPFGIAVSGTTIYVAYAVQAAPANRDATSGAGLGLVDEFDPNGNFVKRLLGPGGALNAPWGMAMAPAGRLGAFSGALLVANTGDGSITAFNASTGALLGSLSDAGGAALAIPALHGIAFGNRYANQPDVTLFFTSGTSNGVAGGYGRIDFGAAPRLHAPPVVTVGVLPCGGFYFRCFVGPTVRAGVTAAAGVARVDFYRQGSYAASVNASPYQTVVRLTLGPVLLPPSAISATATDVDGNVGSAP